MTDQLKTIIVVILAIVAYHYRSTIGLIDDLVHKGGTVKNQEIIAKFGDYYTEDGGVTYENPRHKPRKFYHEDYESYFSVFVPDQLITDESIKALVDAHDIYQDKEYLNDPLYYDDLARIYGLYIENGGNNDRRLYVSYVGPGKGYGAFAAVDLSKGSFIGEYTGILTNNSANTDYAWTVIYFIYKYQYFSKEVKDANGKDLDLMIDSRVVGNVYSKFIMMTLQDLLIIMMTPMQSRQKYHGATAGIEFTLQLEIFQRVMKFQCLMEKPTGRQDREKFFNNALFCYKVRIQSSSYYLRSTKNHTRMTFIKFDDYVNHYLNMRFCQAVCKYA